MADSEPQESAPAVETDTSAANSEVTTEVKPPQPKHSPEEMQRREALLANIRVKLQGTSDCLADVELKRYLGTKASKEKRPGYLGRWLVESNQYFELCVLMQRRMSRIQARYKKT